MEQVIFIASDHAGFALKKELIPWLKNRIENTHLCSIEPAAQIHPSIKDLGCDSAQEVDYPIYAHKLAHALLEAEAIGKAGIGILVCGSGLGMAMVVNKYPQLRAAPCYTPALGHLARAHNNAQVLCLGARQITTKEAQAIIIAFLSARFEGNRHARRVQQFNPPISNTCA